MNRYAFRKEKTWSLIVPIVLFLIVAITWACAGAPVNNVEKTWYKPNITQQEYAKDRFECMKESQQTKYQARETAKRIIETDSSDWWFKDKGDWWINGNKGRNSNGGR